MKLIFILFLSILMLASCHSSKQSNLPDQESALTSATTEPPIATIKRIFDQYNSSNESTDSPGNLADLKQALTMLEIQSVSIDDLTLIINVWMYYTVTDFSSVEYTENVLFAHREQSIVALKARIKNKKKWESKTGAPYADLPILLQKLENN